jgi:hypothetical protein
MTDNASQGFKQSMLDPSTEDPVSSFEPTIEDGDHIALFNYEKQSDDEMSLEKDDRLIFMDKSNTQWWLARNMMSNTVGYVPVSFIKNTKDMTSHE